MVVYSVSKLCSYSDGAIENVKKIHKERTENTYKCKCGHSVAIKPYEKKVLCHWCNKWVFKNEKDEFKFRLEEQRRKVK